MDPVQQRNWTQKSTSGDVDPIQHLALSYDTIQTEIYKATYPYQKYPLHCGSSPTAQPNTKIDFGRCGSNPTARIIMRHVSNQNLPDEIPILLQISLST